MCNTTRVCWLHAWKNIQGCVHPAPLSSFGPGMTANLLWQSLHYPDQSALDTNNNTPRLTPQTYLIVRILLCLVALLHAWPWYEQAAKPLWRAKFWARTRETQLWDRVGWALESKPVWRLTQRWHPRHSTSSLCFWVRMRVRTSSVSQCCGALICVVAWLSGGV